MKTKQKAIRRNPFLSCSPSSDLYPAVKHMDCSSETSKRKQSVCESIGMTTWSDNVNKRICRRYDSQGIQMPKSWNQGLAESYESTQPSFDNSSSMGNSTSLSKNQMSSSHNISTNNGYTYQHTTVGQPSLPMSSQHVTTHFPTGDNKGLQLQTTEVNSHTQVTMPSSSVSSQRSYPKRVTHRRIKATSSPMETQGTNTEATRTVQVPNIADTSNNRAKRPRFTQVTMPSSSVSSVSSIAKRVTHRRIKATSSPMETQGTNTEATGTVQVPNIVDTSNNRAKRPRFTQDNKDELDKDHQPHTFLLAGVTKFADIARLCFGMTSAQNRAIDDTQIAIDAATTLKEILDTHNELVKLFRTARDKMEDSNIPDFKLKLFGVVGSKQYDLPTCDCIGAIVFEGGPDVSTEYDVVIEKRDGQPQQIDKLNPHYMSLHFPLLFIHGEVGYHLGLKLLDKAGEPPEKEKQMSMKILMAGTSNTMSLAEARGKEIVTQPDNTKLVTLKATNLDKSIYVKVYRKWTLTNKASLPVMHCCILLDQEA
ncbi:hypothetical protein CTI12_AA521300 [Artemisia annua]|uniref:Helitron helicase-like domain-containing protein n=1 Tax=Artemisia annua TaxID=35608 RepID=A0A2U1L7U3_ARTAN|nr:hypothetical protein CTI12_AA521300 [Artemisia annua]